MKHITAVLHLLSHTEAAAVTDRPSIALPRLVGIDGVMATIDSFLPPSRLHLLPLLSLNQSDDLEYRKILEAFRRVYSLGSAEDAKRSIWQSAEIKKEVKARLAGLPLQTIMQSRAGSQGGEILLRVLRDHLLTLSIPDDAALAAVLDVIPGPLILNLSYSRLTHAGFARLAGVQTLQRLKLSFWQKMEIK
jgi:hypothetical protein